MDTRISCSGSRTSFPSTGRVSRSVPRKIRAAIERIRDDAALTKWVEIFVTRSAAEIAAAVIKK